MKYDNMFVRSCNRGDLDAIIELQNDIFLGLQDSSWLRKNSPDLLLMALTPPNLTVGVFVDKILIAIGMAVDPEPPETDLRANLQKMRVEKAIDLKLVMVRAAYRGRGLQKAIMWILEKQAFVQGYKYLCTSVSPYNMYSLRNVLGMGFLLDHQEVIYDGLLRNIYVKEIDVNRFMNQITLLMDQNVIKNNLSIEDHLSAFIAGDSSLSFTGDIVEFTDLNTGEHLFGILNKHTHPFVMLPNKDNRWEAVLFLQFFNDNRRIDKIWINTMASVYINDDRSN